MEPEECRSAPGPVFVGRFRLGARIGAGATAEVFEAFDTVLEREAAVKVFRRPDPALDDDPTDRFDEEVRLLASLVHPHVLPLYDAGVDRDRRFLVMPLIRGTTLARTMRRGPLEPAEVRRVGTAVADALAYVHSLGIVHRDVKPTNILMAEDGMPYLADFGLAHDGDSPMLTAYDCVVGTPGYLAPERAEGRRAGPASDVYALGLVLLEALTGEREYSGTPMERAIGNAMRTPTLPEALADDWHAALSAMTARDPADRPDASDIRTLLTRLGDEPYRIPSSVATAAFVLGPPSMTTEPEGSVDSPSVTVLTHATPPPRPRRRAAVLSLLTVAILAVGLPIGTHLLDADATGTGRSTTTGGNPGAAPTRDQLPGGSLSPASPAGTGAVGPLSSSPANVASPSQPSADPARAVPQPVTATNPTASQPPSTCASSGGGQDSQNGNGGKGGGAGKCHGHGHG